MYSAGNLHSFPPMSGLARPFFCVFELLCWTEIMHDMRNNQSLELLEGVFYEIDSTSSWYYVGLVDLKKELPSKSSPRRLGIRHVGFATAAACAAAPCSSSLLSSSGKGSRSGCLVHSVSSCLVHAAGHIYRSSPTSSCRVRH
mmetsp:Transcript_852/g.1980  ORF Transcript_852/g.1980 Transcript_852/m.1980 type:complete len:143 (-) Transcript_852:5714-6142(-)